MFGAKQPEKKPEPEKKPPEQEQAEAKLSDKKADERDRVTAWRLLKMMDAGYPFEIANRLSDRFDIDSTYACRLLNEGWTPKDAERILL